MYSRKCPSHTSVPAGRVRCGLRESFAGRAKGYAGLRNSINQLDLRSVCHAMTNPQRRKYASAQGSDSTNMACFPAAATVQLADGATKSMASLQLGDAVLDATGAYSPVYFFSHAEGAITAPFIELVLENDYKLSLSPDHYVGPPRVQLGSR